jgi:serine-type D-Ala-D-Ala carboxypeptidase (penicillin-binding protein 5/6)
MEPARRIARILSSLLALALVLATVYAAGAFLSPIPPLTVVERPLDATPLSAGSSGIVLPETGASAVALPEGQPITAGSTEVLPIAGIAKLVLALIAIEDSSLEPGRTGGTITIDQDDLQRQLGLQASGVRVVPVSLAETWTVRDLLITTVIASGNNTAELLAESVFGSVDSYVVRAAEWLAANDMTDTVVVDATGLNRGSQSTARDLGLLVQRIAADPVLSEILRERPRRVNGVGFDDNSAVVPELGVLGAANTYTDAAGVCQVMLVPVDGALIGAVIIGQPTYADANAAVAALVPSLQEGIAPLPIVSIGDVVGELRSDWGARVDLVAVENATVLAFDAGEVTTRLIVGERRSVLRGASVGLLQIETPAGVQSVRVETAGGISEPGIKWRFADPRTVLERWTG